MKKLLVGLFLISSVIAFSNVQTIPYEKMINMKVYKNITMKMESYKLKFQLKKV